MYNDGVLYKINNHMLNGNFYLKRSSLLCPSILLLPTYSSLVIQCDYEVFFCPVWIFAFSSIDLLKAWSYLSKLSVFRCLSREDREDVPPYALKNCKMKIYNRTRKMTTARWCCKIIQVKIKTKNINKFSFLLLIGFCQIRKISGNVILI